jgi:hypothetical protein
LFFSSFSFFFYLDKQNEGVLRQVINQALVTKPAQGKDVLTQHPKAHNIQKNIS